MKNITAEKAIEMLVMDDTTSILHGGESGLIYLNDILLHGHNGYNIYSRTWLEQELLKRFDTKYKITKKV